MHQTLLWHHRLGHPSLPRLCGMHSPLLVYGLPRSLPSLPRSLAPPCLPCVKGRQLAAPHSYHSSSADTPHGRVRPRPRHWTGWRMLLSTGCRRLNGLHHGLPLVEQGGCPWCLDPLDPRCPSPALRSVQSCSFESCSHLLEDFCGAEGIVQSYTLPASPQLNGIAERRIGLGDPDALDIPTPRSYAKAIMGLYSSNWQIAMDAKMAPREWHDTLGTTLMALGFAPSTPDPSLFLRTDTSLPPFYVLLYVNDLIFATADTEALALVKAKLQERHTYTDLGPSALRLLVILATVHSSAYKPLALSSTFGRVHASWADDRMTPPVDTGVQFQPRHWFCLVEELRWLTYLLTDLGERPHSPLFLYVDNKAMIALCQDQRLEHRTKHIALRYFLMRELQQRGQLCLAYVAIQANTADVFTKAPGSSDHQRFCTAVGLVPTLPHLLVS
ncbi:unnamed protein product [Closterium sp. NIES-53]